MNTYVWSDRLGVGGYCFTWVEPSLGKSSHSRSRGCHGHSGWPEAQVSHSAACVKGHFTVPQKCLQDFPWPRLQKCSKHLNEKC